MKGMANVFQPQFPFKGVVAAMANLVRGNAFSPASLFAQGEPGVWYDPSDLSTLFQDSAGATPVTAVEQPVGLMLDKSKGQGSELVTNGTFDTDISGWVASPQFPSSSAVEWSNGSLHVYNTENNYGESRSAAIPLTIGKRYVLEMDILNGTTSSYWIIISNSESSDNAGRIAVTSEASGTSPSGYKRWRYSFVASYDTAYLYFATNKLAGSHLYADNISVRELPGNHAYQTTATSRPVLSARVNLLTKTEQFNDAYWTKYLATVSANSVIAPDGTTTADTLTATGANGGSVYVLYNPAGTYTISVYAKAGTSSTIYLTWSSNGNGRQAIFTLSGAGIAGEVSNAGAGGLVSGGTSSITNVGNGWYRCVISDLVCGANSGGYVVTVPTQNQTAYIWGASLVPANQSSLPYQRVNTATDYDTVGFPHYLRFDGVDDFLVTPTITPGTDKAQVFAGVRKLSDTLIGIVVSLGTYVSGNTFELQAPNINNSNYYQWVIHGNGTSATDNDFNAYRFDGIAPLTTVVTGTADRSIANTSGVSAKANGVLAARVSTTLTGTNISGDFSVLPLYIGRRAGTTYPFNGHLYSLIVRFGNNLPAATIEKTEKYINTKTRAY